MQINNYKEKLKFKETKDTNDTMYMQMYYIRWYHVVKCRSSLPMNIRKSHFSGCNFRIQATLLKPTCPSPKWWIPVSETQEITNNPTFRAFGSIRKPANQQCCSSHSRPKEQFNSACCGDGAGGGFSPFKFLGCLPLPRFTTIRMSEHSVPQKLIADWFRIMLDSFGWFAGLNAQICTKKNPCYWMLLVGGLITSN